MTIINPQVGSSADDRTDKDSGSREAVNAGEIRIYRHSSGSFLRMHGGFRFTGLGIPQGAIVSVAYAQLYIIADDDPYCDIYCEDQESPPNFADGSTLIQNRMRTTASAEWAVMNIGAGAFKDTPSLVDPIQEIVTDYDVDTLVLLFIAKAATPLMALMATSWDGDSERAAKLYIEYEYTTGIVPLRRRRM